MYFTDITNPELQYFHGLTVPNLSISLNDILEHGNRTGLFKVDTVIEDEIYKIYPLFNTGKIYCDEEITILEDKCIICNKPQHDIYFNFINNDVEPVINFNWFRTYFKLNQKLTTAEFNALITLFRNKKMTDNITIKNKTVKGKYADYVFDLESTTIIDNGVLITKETRDNIGTVKLINPVFANSEYTLKLKVYSIKDYNILNQNDNIIVTELNVPLKLNTDIEIPFNTLDLNNVVSFDAEVIINHNGSNVQYTRHLSLNVIDNTYVLQPVTLTTVYDKGGTLLTNKPVKFYNGDELIGESVTDEEGVAVFEFTPVNDGDYYFEAVAEDEVSSNIVTCNIIKHSTNLTLNTSKNVVHYQLDGSATVSGVLTREGLSYANQNIKLYDNGNLIKTIKTNNKGYFGYDISSLSVHNYMLQAIYDGNENEYRAESNYINVVVRKRKTTTTATPDKTTVYPNETVTFTGKVIDEIGEPRGMVNVIVNNDNSNVINTDHNGVFTYTTSISAIGDKGFTFEYVPGAYTIDGWYAGSKTNTINVTCNKFTTATEVVLRQDNYQYMDTILINVSSNNEEEDAFQPDKVTVLFNNNTYVITNKTPYNDFLFELPQVKPGNYYITARYNGDNYYEDSTDTVNIDVIEPVIDELILAQDGRNLVLTFKSKGFGIPNKNINGTVITLSNPEVSWVINTDDVTNNDGKFILPVTQMGIRGTAYFSYNGVKSNTINYNF